MKRWPMKLWIGLTLVFALPAWGHEVKLSQTAQTAQLITLQYADGQPFAFEAYELYPAGETTPFQVGRTNAQGQLVFVPDSRSEWRLKAYSADGHGVDQTLTATPSQPGQPLTSTSLPRPLLLVAGLGIIFGLFGFYQLFLRRQKP